ncbi:MAG: S1C family serine protease [Cyanophyceae cyanobacterium]
MIQRAITAQLATELAAIAHRLRHSTVKISSSRGSAGSGVIWRSDGLIVTNAHVVWAAPTLVELANGQILNAQVRWRDPDRDLAVLRVPATLPAVTVGHSQTLRPGELVLAVGNPLGTTGALTTGTVYSSSAGRLARNLRRQGRSRWGDRWIRLEEAPLQQDWLRANIRLAPGNSGGPLATAQGHVIGINTMIAGGLALAIPSHEVERFLAREESL